MLSEPKMIECQKMFWILYKIFNFITKAMENWRVELTIVEFTLFLVKNQRAISMETHSRHFNL